MRKIIYSLLLALCVGAFAACESKTSNMDEDTTRQTNTDAAEGNTGVGVGATGTNNSTGETGTVVDEHHPDSSHEGHMH